MQKKRNKRFGTCLRAVGLDGWTSLFLGSAHIVMPSEASSPVHTKELLLSLQQSWSIIDDEGLYASSNQVLGWHPGSDPCLDLWRGVECACTVSGNPGCQENEVVALNLSADSIGRQLYGTVPDIFDQLPRLQHLNLRDHRLHGLLPRTIFQHPSLITVVLRNNLLYGPLQAPLDQPSTLSMLDVEFNMLSGELNLALCNVAKLRMSGNSLLCGSLPRCMRHMTLNTASGTGLEGGGGFARDCRLPVASCNAPPGPFPHSLVNNSLGLETRLCKASIDKIAIGRVPITIYFSAMTNVDVLTVEFTDFGLHNYRAWFWAQDAMLRTLMDPQAQKWAGTRLSAPHGISRPGGQTSRSTPPNALTVNVADLPGDLLQPSQLAISVTAFRIIPEGTEADVEASSESLGQHNVSFLQITAPYVPVQQTPPKVLYASIDESLTDKAEVKVRWEVQHQYRIQEKRVLLLYSAQSDWNGMVQSIANASPEYVFATSPALNETANTYTFRWKTLTDAVAAKVPESDGSVQDSSGGFASSQASFSGGESRSSEWWRTRESLPTQDGGTLASPSFLFGLGMEHAFPPGVYMISIQVVDEVGITGSSVVGPMILEDTIAQHGTVLLAAYIFATSIITSALVYWCIQRFLHGYIAKLLRMDPMRIAIREVEDFFHELTQGMQRECASVVDLTRDCEMCLVVSDMENSTLLSVESPAAFAASQEVHDALMMELIQQCCGVELMREGDSFRVAFKSAEMATAFCLKVQLQLLETPWASSILSMTGCEEKYDEHGRLLFAGIRVRLGLYWASEGSVVVLFNEGTSTYNVQGPGMDAAVTVSDSAHGGQTVVTGDVWNQIQHRLPLAGFPVFERLGNFHYPDGCFSGELYQICGRIYRPLARSFPPLRGGLIENGSHSCVSKSETSLNRSVTSHASHYTVSYDQDHTETAPQTLVCCSVKPLVTHDHLGMDSDQKRQQDRVRDDLEKLVDGYAKQWCGIKVTWDWVLEKTNNASPWVWMFSFHELAGALRFVFSMQYGMLSEVWSRSSHPIFPPSEKGIDGRIVYHGPRVTVVVHNVSLFPGACTSTSWKSNHHSLSSTLEKTSEDTPTDCSSGNRGFVRNQKSSSVQGSFKAAAAEILPVEGQKNMGLDSKRAAHTLNSFARRQSLSGTDFSRSSGSPQNDTGSRSNMKRTDCESGTLIDDTATVLSNSALKLQQTQSFRCTISTSQSLQQLKVQSCPQSIINQSSQQTDPPEHMRASQEQACQNEQFASSVRSDGSHSNVHQTDASFLATLTSCGLLNPGQTILTDSAFANYQDSQIGNCEVYDHGVFIFEDFGVTVSLKELLPARLRGRQVMAPNDGIEGTFKVQKGYHDAPCIDKPMCICFCKLTMPKAVRASERLLLDLWARQQQRADQDAGNCEPTQGSLGDSAGHAAASASSQSICVFPMPPLSARHALLKCQRRTRNEYAEVGRVSKGSQDQNASMTSEHAALMQIRVTETLRPDLHEQVGMGHVKDIHKVHADKWSGGRRGTTEWQLDPQQHIPSNTTSLHEAHVGRAKPFGGTGPVHADVLALSNSTCLLPSPQCALSEKVAEGASFEAHERYMDEQLKELQRRISTARSRLDFGHKVTRTGSESGRSLRQPDALTSTSTYNMEQPSRGQSCYSLCQSKKASHTGVSRARETNEADQVDHGIQHEMRQVGPSVSYPQPHPHAMQPPSVPVHEIPAFCSRPVPGASQFSNESMYGGPHVEADLPLQYLQNRHVCIDIPPSGESVNEAAMESPALESWPPTSKSSGVTDPCWSSLPRVHVDKSLSAGFTLLSPVAAPEHISLMSSAMENTLFCTRSLASKHTYPASSCSMSSTLGESATQEQIVSRGGPGSSAASLAGQADPQAGLRDGALGREQKQSECSEAQSIRNNDDEGGVQDIITAFSLVVSWSVTVATYSRVLLDLLEQHGGYLCKETDPGKFTVAFHSWHAGLVWAACMRQQLALQHYPEDILALQELAATYSEDGTLTSRGVQPQIGCCHGKLQRKRPTGTGRADYYGVTANTAARIMSKACPGQTLIGGIASPSASYEAGGETNVVEFESSNVTASAQQPGIVRLLPLGRHLLKGIRKPVAIFEAQAQWLPRTGVQAEKSSHPEVLWDDQTSKQ